MTETKDALDEYWKSPEYAARQKELVLKQRKHKAFIITLLGVTALASIPISAWLVSSYSIHMGVAFFSVWGGGFCALMVLGWGVASPMDRSGAFWMAGAMVLVGGLSLFLSTKFGFDVLALVGPLCLFSLFLTLRERRKRSEEKPAR